ncbi:uncharacterized protein EV154DRAFT_527985 [Mucor mucedo]|uniref:Uncharacterized protein n=1 Tax=Mucor saturninus TaxID=64648 RepID=A0A8H7QPJ7_9FUNG|nr:uncharacterized protein EV154DRAFT_527985 [Mucor mucedo]KAG2195925.1 hypothetical protein INT47_002698 [Mucor saturninus]KAI7873521.1 hypothetical protein EV154DRAFT_527985 [Mucor mucedo]
MVFSSKISRIKSVRLGFKSKTETTSSSPPPTRREYNPSSPASNKVASFSETLLVISKEAKNTEFDDVFDSFFFSDKRCQNRALYMAARLKGGLDGIINPIRPSSSYGTLVELQQPLVLAPSHSTPLKSTPSSSVDGFWRMVAHRLYTLNYILFVLPSDSKSRIEFLNKMEANLSRIGDGNEIHRRGGMEAHFAIRYALDHKRPKRRKTLLEDAFELEKRNGGNVAGAVLPTTGLDEINKTNSLVEKARIIIEQCLESESKLSNSEKDAMYIFHSMRNGLHGAFEPHIELEEDRNLRHRLKRTVDQNNQVLKNPFEDEDCIVTEDDSNKSSREVDSGFYDGWAISA